MLQSATSTVPSRILLVPGRLQSYSGSVAGDMSHRQELHSISRLSAPRRVPATNAFWLLAFGALGVLRPLARRSRSRGLCRVSASGGQGQQKPRKKAGGFSEASKPPEQQGVAPQQTQKVRQPPAGGIIQQPPAASRTFSSEVSATTPPAGNGLLGAVSGAVTGFLGWATAGLGGIANAAAEANVRRATEMAKPYLKQVLGDDLKMEAPLEKNYGFVDAEQSALVLLSVPVSGSFRSGMARIEAAVVPGGRMELRVLQLDGQDVPMENGKSAGGQQSEALKQSVARSVIDVEGSSSARARLSGPKS
ncbi:unnamed protein product [Polarella glacialis]|nr:unnamed protein product [Polarella glacialis]